MKFSDKLVTSCLITIAIIFSLGAAIMLYQNHENQLRDTMKQKENAHLVESFSLESKLIQDAQDYATDFGKDSILMDRKAIYYVQQYAALQRSGTTLYAISDNAHEILYANAPQILLEQADAKNTSLLQQNEQVYATLQTTIVAGSQTYFLRSFFDISPLYQERMRQYQSFILIDCIMLLLSFFLIYGISTYLTKPIKRLNIASQRIAKGNYEERTKIETKDEIGALSRSFDEMADEIQATIGQLQHSADAKEAFIAAFSHEIKTPMTAILGFADMLRTYDCDSETRQKASDYIYTEGQRLDKLSHTLMDLLSLSNEPCKLYPINFSDIILSLQQYYEGCNLRHILTFACDEAIIRSNEELLFTLLRNLIDNACKASDEAQPILITGIKTAHKYLVTVEDHGIGMSEQDIAMADQPFFMADRSRSRKSGGAGLGLSLVKRILELHHTSLHITSKPSAGTTISFTLEVHEDEA